MKMNRLRWKEENNDILIRGMSSSIWKCKLRERSGCRLSWWNIICRFSISHGSYEIIFP